MQDYGVYGHSLIKKRGNWPKNVPGDAIYSYFANKELASAKTFRQVSDGKPFLVHCHKYNRFVKKLMSNRGVINEIPSHKTYRRVAGEWKTFNYTKPISRHNHSKHWVYDVNARRHDPVGLEDVWHTKWCPRQQFTFLCSLSDFNALNSWAFARRLPAKSQMAFWRKLAR